MALYIYWFLLALIFIGLEMATGTFYLLMLAVAMAIGGLAALLGADLVWQLVLSAVAVIAGTIILRRWKGGQAQANVTSSLDAGQAVKILSWRDDSNARVFYRGAEWDAELESPESIHEGTFYIKSIRGSVLVLTHHKSD
jgi:membrane protein implicated in regulation of membrane protease activity